MQCLQDFRVSPDRRLVFSPRWGNHSVIFDSRSGDLWVVDCNTADALKAAMPEGGNQDPCCPAHFQLPPDTLENLVSHGIIEVSGTS